MRPQHRTPTPTAWLAPQRTLWGARCIGATLVATVLLAFSSHRERADHGAAAAPLAAPQAIPQIQLPGPSFGLIGGDVELSASFVNVGGPNDLGYGPFIDIVIDRHGVDGNAANEMCDGLQLVAGSTLLAGASATDVKTFGGGDDCTSKPTVFKHPFVPGHVTVPLGHQLVSVRLPVGSYAPGAPPLAIQFLNRISSFADDGVPLRVYARAGFIYGNSPNGTTPILSHGDDVMGDGWEFTTITPLVMLTGKKYLGPEDEAATGPSHLGDYPLRYEVSVAIAPGQTIDDLVLVDMLPDDLVFDGFVSTTAGCKETPPGATPAVGAEVKLECPTAQGIVTMVFEFHMDRLDAGGAPVVNLNTCDPTISIDDVAASGMWDPLDPRDKPAKQVSVDVKPDDHKLANKCVAVQKSVKVAVDHGAPGPTPGDLLDYTLAFQVTDFSAFGNIVLEDFLSDGQSFAMTGQPLLTVSDGSLAAPLEVEWRPADFAPVSVPGRACKAGYPDDGSPFEITGGSLVEFDVSALLKKQTGTGSSTIEKGILLGAAVPGGKGKPGWGTIRFRVRIDQSFVHPQPAAPATPGNPAVDKHDPLCNEVDLRAERMNQGEIPGVYTSTGIWAADDSKAAVQIVPGSLEKRVVGRNGDWDTLMTDPVTGLPMYSPGDTITFEIEKQIPSGDAEEIVIEDWLPSPTLDNQEFVGMTLPLLPCSSYPNVDLPPAGQACWFTEPTQLATTNASLPSGSVGPGNSVRFEFGDLSGAGVTPRSLHVRLTATVTEKPYADGLKQVNIARECEQNTLGKTYCDVYVAEFVVAAPRLVIRKGVIWTSKPDAEYSAKFGSLKGPINACRKDDATGWPVHSTKLNGSPITLPDADILSGLDAGDLVRYAIVIENTGHAVEGAFDVRIRDALPPELINPTIDCVTDGVGLVEYDIKLPNGLLTGGYLELDDPAPAPMMHGTQGAIEPFHPTNGKNLAIVIIEAEVAAHDAIEAGCYTNLAELENYAGVEGGKDHVSAGLAWNTSDPASICIKPAIEKAISKTSEQHTSDTEDGSKAHPRPVTIGEIVEYEIFVDVPEGQVPNLIVEDLLPVDLAYVPGSVVVTAVDAGITGVTAQSTTKPAVSGGPFHCLYGAKAPTFDFGLVANASTTINNGPKGFRFTFDAQVCNTTNNNHGELKPNIAKVWGGTALPATSNEVTVEIVEPSLTLSKTIGAAAPYPPAVGNAVPYEVTLTNDGGLSAYMVRLKDVLPSGLQLVGSPAIDQSPGGCAVGLMPSGGLQLLIMDMPPDCTVALRFDARILDDTCDALINVAHASWASLPRGIGTRKPTTLNPTFNQTGSEVEGASGAPHGARDGSDGGGGEPNDYVRVVERPLCGQVCGVKCEDKNKNGLCDPGEEHLEGWEIELSKGGMVVEQIWTAQAPTAAGDLPLGSYCFDVFPGFVTIGENMTQQQKDDEWEQTGPLPVPPGEHAFDVGYGDDWQGINFANWKPLRCEAVVHGVKFEDTNGNGVWDQPGEKGLQGWTIAATPVGGGTSVSTVTDANGEYWLVIPGPGSFVVDEVDQTGWVQTYPTPPRRYVMDIRCDPGGTVLSVDVKVEGVSGSVAANELHFGNRPIVPCTGSKLPGLGRLMYAWGDRPFGAIGGIPAAQSPTGVNIDLQAVDQGNFHTAGLTVQGTVMAWGGPPTAPASTAGAPFTKVSAGHGFTAALDQDGAIHIWRDKQFNHEVMDYALPNCPPNSLLSKQYCVTVPTLSSNTFIALDAGINAVMAIDVDGHLHTWGHDNSEGQLPGCAIGTGAPGKCFDDSKAYVAVSTEGYGSLAIDSTGTIHGWGWNQYDVLPGGCASSDHACKKDHPSFGSFTAIEHAGTHTLALDDDGALWAWGNTSVAKPPTPGFDMPFMGTQGTGFTAIAGGSSFSLAMRPDGTLEAWGWFGVSNFTPITPPQGVFYAITGGGLDFGHAAALRCPVKLTSGGVIGQIFLPSAWRQAGPGVVNPNPTTMPTAEPTALPTRRPTWTPAPPPGESPTPRPNSTPSPTASSTATASATATGHTPSPPATRTSTATTTPTATTTATPRPATPSITPTGSPTATATQIVLPPAIRGEIRTERGCAEEPAEVRYAQGETVPIQVRIFDEPRATVRVIYRWTDGGQERQIDGGTIEAGRVYSVSPPLVIPAEAPLGGRHVRLEVQEPGGSYRTLDSCGFTVVEGGGPTPEPTRTPTPDVPPAGECMPLEQLPGLVGWWRFDEQRGELALDAIGSPTFNHGQIYGQPNRGAGMVGGALRFDGATNYVEVPDDGSLDFEASPRGDLTLDAWVKLPADAQTSGVHVLMNKQATSGGPGYQLYLWNAQPGLQLADGSGFSNFGSGVAIPKDGQWHLLVVTVVRDRSDGGRFYLDGEPVGSPFDPTVRPGSLANDAVLRIGAPSFATSSLFDGWLDEVEVLRGALSAEAVARLERARSAGKCPPRAVPTVPPLREYGAPRRAR